MQPWQNTGNVRCRDTENDFLAQSEDDGGLTFSNQVVEDAIDELNSGKSPFEYGLVSQSRTTSFNSSGLRDMKVSRQQQKHEKLPCMQGVKTSMQTNEI